MAANAETRNLHRSPENRNRNPAAQAAMLAMTLLTVPAWGLPRVEDIGRPLLGVSASREIMGEQRFSAFAQSLCRLQDWLFKGRLSVVYSDIGQATVTSYEEMAYREGETITLAELKLSTQAGLAWKEWSVDALLSGIRPFNSGYSEKWMGACAARLAYTHENAILTCTAIYEQEEWTGNAMVCARLALDCYHLTAGAGISVSTLSVWQVYLTARAEIPRQQCGLGLEIPVYSQPGLNRFLKIVLFKNWQRAGGSLSLNLGGYEDHGAELSMHLFLD